MTADPLASDCRMFDRRLFRRDEVPPEKEDLPSVRAAIRRGMAEEMRRDEDIIQLGEDIATAPPFGVTSGLADEFGRERIRNIPATEEAAVGAAVGAATQGVRSVVEFQFGDFLSVAIDQLTHQAAMLRYLSGGQVSVPIVLRLPCGGGQSTGPQHSQSLYSWFVHVPGIKVALPSTPMAAKGLIKSAIRDENPVCFFEHKSLYSLRLDAPEAYEDPEHTIPFGEAAVRREGADVTVVATLAMVHHALRAAEKLANDGIDIEVIDPRTLVPLDTQTILESVQKTGRLVVVDEAYLPCGIQAEITAQVVESVFDSLEAPPRRLGNPSVPVPFAPTMEDEILPNYRDIVTAAKATLG